MADWDTSNPTDNAIVAQFPANERSARSALVTNFGVDHSSTNDSNVGKHTVVHLLEQSAQTATAGEGKLYAKDTSGQSELFWISDTGSPVQLTTGAGLNAAALVGSLPAISGASLTSLNASNLASGTVPDARFPATLPALNGSALTNLTAANVTGSHTLPDGVLSTNVPLLNAANTFTNATQTISSTSAVLRLDETDGGTNQRYWDISAASSGLFAVTTRNDALAGIENALLFTRSGGNLSLIEIGPSRALAEVKIANVAASDFARLSQNNTFTGATQTISAAGTTEFRVTDSSDSVTAYVGAFNGGAYLGARTNHSAGIYTNDTARLVVSNGGNFDFKAGTVTTSNSSASEVGFKGAPSTDISASTNTAAATAGTTIRLTGGSGQTYTLDSDPPEDSVVIIDNASGNSWTIAASSSLVWAATGGTGSRTLANGGMAAALHQGAGVWKISGGGLS